jgi:hypothetical protein
MPNPKFHAILKKMADMHDKKSADYATDSNYYSNFENAAVSAGTPVDAVFRTMIGIKLARLAELQGKGKTPKNESVMDSLIDLAVYATLYASYYEPAELPYEGYIKPLTAQEIAEIKESLKWPSCPGELK